MTFVSPASPAISSLGSSVGSAQPDAAFIAPRTPVASMAGSILPMAASPSRSLTHSLYPSRHGLAMRDTQKNAMEDNGIESDVRMMGARTDLPKALTPAVVEALLDAAAAFHCVDVMEHEGKVLCILGESHIKLPVSARAGEAVLDQFPMRILEGASLPEGQSNDEEKREVGGLWGAYFNMLHDIKNVSRGLLEGSTIHVAAGQKGQEVQGEPVVNLPMEEGHVASFREAATFEWMPQYLAAAVIVNFAHQFKDQLPPNTGAMVEIAFQVLQTQNTLAYVDTVIGGRLSDHALGSVANPVSGILHGRSETMAKNIASAMAEHATEDKPILAIMGSAHVHKVKRELGQKYDFKGVSLPGQPAGDTLLHDAVRKASSDMRMVKKWVESRSNSEPLN